MHDGNNEEDFSQAFISIIILLFFISYLLIVFFLSLDRDGGTLRCLIQHIPSPGNSPLFSEVPLDAMLKVQQHTTQHTPQHTQKEHYNILHCTTLHHTTLHYTTLHYIIPHYTTFHYIKLHFNTRRTLQHGVYISSKYTS